MTRFKRKRGALPDYLVLDPTIMPAQAPPPHLIHNLVRETGSVIVYGPTGVGKSRFLWQCACAWSRGEPAFGLRPRSALRVVFVEADMDEHETRAFVYELAAAGCQPTDRMRLICYRRDLFLLTTRTRFGLAQTPLVDWLAAQVQALQADLVIYDALADLHDVEGNSQSEAHTVLRHAQAAAAGRAYIGVLTQRKLSLEARGDDRLNIEDTLGSQAWNRRANTTLRCIGTPPHPMTRVAVEKPRLAPAAAFPAIELRMTKQGLFEAAQTLDEAILEAVRALPALSQRALARALPARLPACFPHGEEALRKHIVALVDQGRLGFHNGAIYPLKGG